jgi:ADP-ribose pyrophosphatase YjhB (NUDIX family)
MGLGVSQSPVCIDYFDDPAAPSANSIVPSVTAVVRNDAGELLLVHKTDNGLWALPGGGVDPGESVTMAVGREVKEETGIDVVIDDLVGVYTDPRHVMAYEPPRTPPTGEARGSRGPGWRILATVCSAVGLYLGLVGSLVLPTTLEAGAELAVHSPSSSAPASPSPPGKAPQIHRPLPSDRCQPRSSPRVRLPVSCHTRCVVCRGARRRTRRSWVGGRVAAKHGHPPARAPNVDWRMTNRTRP